MLFSSSLVNRTDDTFVGASKTSTCSTGCRTVLPRIVRWLVSVSSMPAKARVAGMSQVLPGEQIDGSRTDGFLVVGGLAGPQACADPRRPAVEMVEAFEPSDRRSIFT